MSQPTQRASRLSGLDGLRALAAFSVLSYHAAEWSKFAFAGPLAPLFWELKGGVAVFFVISGAVLYLPYARAIRDGARLPDWRSFARRRAIRILPAYWVAVTVVGVGPFSAGVFGPDTWHYYGLSQIYRPHTVFTGLPGAWSLCVEVTFYALLPFFARAGAGLARRVGSPAAVRGHLVLIGLAAAATILFRGFLAGSLIAPTQGDGVSVALPAFLDWFAIGMALAVLVAEREAGRARGGLVGRLAARPRWCVMLAVVAFGAGIPAQHGDIFLPWYGLVTHVALGVGSGLLVLAVLVRNRERAAASRIRVLDTRCLTWLGTISYGVYLWNRVVIELVSRHAESRGLDGAILLWLIASAGALILGAASWYLVERPCQRWFRSREARRERRVSGGRMDEIDVSVHSTLDPLNPSGVAVDHLA